MSWTQKCVVYVCVCALVRTQVIPGKSRTNDGDYNTVNTDGSFDFGYTNTDRGASYHLAHGNANGLVGGRFGARDPATDTVKETVYTAGPRGFRAKGANIHRKMDLDQRPRGPIGNKDDPYFDPNEDPSYGFKFDTRTYSKNENADSRGDVKGHYSFVDDVGERHDVSYIAGRDTGFHVSSAHPDSPNLIGSPFHRAPLVRGETRPRGRTAVQRGLDGSYKFISAGPDQRRTESSDSHGNVRGSYTFLDDKGVQRTVNYIAGPGIGYRIVKNNKDPYIPSFFPTIPSAYDPDFVGAAASTGFSPDDSGADDVFKGPDGTAASGHVKPPPFPSNDKDRPNKPSSGSTGSTSSNGSGSNGSGSNGNSGFGSGGSNSFGSGPAGGSFGSGSTTGSFGSSTGSGGSFGTGPGSGLYGSGTSGGSYGSGTSGGNFGSGTFGSGTPSGGSTSGSGGDSSEGSDSSDNGYQSPDFGQANEDIGYVDEDVSGFGGSIKPTKGPGKPGRPTSKPYRPTKKPYVPLKPFQPANNKDDDGGYDDGKGDKNTPQFAIGFNIHHTKPGTTIIRNIGQDYFGVPPGVSVRAHVQSIDLYPYDSKPISPSEALEKDKT
ncbi:cuticular protein 73D [Aphomia sociella]